jgi:chemotaxis protein MotB
MGKDPFEDPELQAMRASMRPAAGGVRWGRVLTGAVIVVSVTFALAYYLPLRRAHEALTGQFTDLRAKVDSANREAGEARARAKELDEKQQAVQSQLGQLAQRDQAAGEATRSLKGALESKLQKQISTEQAAVAVTTNRAEVSLSLAYVLSRGKLELSPPGKATLCSVASVSSNRGLRVLAIAGKKDIPPAVAAKLKTPFEFNLAVAQLVAKTLLEQCKVDPAKLSAGAVPSEPASGPKLDGKKLTGPRVELWLESST